MQVTIVQRAHYIRIRKCLLQCALTYQSSSHLTVIHSDTSSDMQYLAIIDAFAEAKYR